MVNLLAQSWTEEQREWILNAVNSMVSMVGGLSVWVYALLCVALVWVVLMSAAVFVLLTQRGGN